MTKDSLQHTSSRNVTKVSNDSSLGTTLAYCFTGDEEAIRIMDEKLTKFSQIIRNWNAEIDSTFLDTLSQKFKKTEIDDFQSFRTMLNRLDDIAQRSKSTQLTATQRQSLEEEFIRSYHTLYENQQKVKNFERMIELENGIRAQVKAKYIKEIEELKKEIRALFILQFRKNLEKVVADIIETPIFYKIPYCKDIDKTFYDLFMRYVYSSDTKEKEKLLLEMEKCLNELPLFVGIELVQ